MIQRCELCNERISTTFLEKLNGTMIKTNDNEKSKKHYVCSSCQKKEHKEDLKEKISKL